MVSFVKGGIKVNGIDELHGAFRRLPDIASDKIISKGVMAAGGIYKNATAAKVQTENLILTGQLRKSMMVRKVKKKFRDKRMAVVGPRSKAVFLRRTAKGKLRGVRSAAQQAKYRAAGVKLYKINPARYAHLVEFGHGPPHRKTKYDRSIGKPLWDLQLKAGGGGFVPPHPYMRPAYVSSISAAKAAFNRVFIASMRDEVKKFKIRRRWW